MSTRTRLGLLVTLIAAGTAPAAAQSTPETSATPPRPQATVEKGSPAAVTPDLIARGDAVFHGPGNCYACHGAKGEGLVGPNLTDSEWIHSKGTYDDIVAQINHGVPKEEAKSGIAMPPKGGSTISDDDVKAVAAYVYSLSHK
jgi:mono/diheme cytochrome c family protein